MIPPDKAPRKRLPPPIAEPEPNDEPPVVSRVRPDNSGVSFRVQVFRNAWPLGVMLSVIFTVGIEIIGACNFGLASADALDLVVIIPLVGLGVGMTTALVAVCFGLSTPVKVSHQGIRVGSLDREFMWWDEISQVKRVRASGTLPYLRVTSSSGRTIDIPVHLRRGEGFVAAVREMSPEDNPLRRELGKA